jgi:hypothetical protein
VEYVRGRIEFLGPEGMTIESGKLSWDFLCPKCGAMHYGETEEALEEARTNCVEKQARLRRRLGG